MHQSTIDFDSPEMTAGIQTFMITRSRLKIARTNCGYCQGDIDPGDTVYTEHVTRKVCCCNACAKSLAKLHAKKSM